MGGEREGRDEGTPVRASREGRRLPYEKPVMKLLGNLREETKTTVSQLTVDDSSDNGDTTVTFF